MICFYHTRSYRPDELAAWVVNKGVEHCWVNHIADLIESQADIKIAWVEPNNDFEYWGHYNYNRLDPAYLKTIVDHCDLVFFWDFELHDYHLPVFEQHNAHKVYWVMPGTVEGQHLAQFKNIVHPYQFWFTMQHYVSTGVLHNRLKQLMTVDQPRSHLFDALLGTVRPHRDFLANKIQSSTMQHKFLWSYQNQQPFKNFLHDQYFNDSDIDVHGLTKHRQSYDGGTWLEYTIDGTPVALAKILPIGVYNNSYYSVVAETGWQNQYVFWTEKIIKPILARRLFVIFSGAHYLKQLKMLGFRTFDCVIDESYDHELDNETRWAKAWDQIVWLSKQDPGNITKQIQSVVDYNYNHAMATDWKKWHWKSVCDVLDSNL